MTIPRRVQFLVGRRDRMGREPEDRVEGGHGVEAPIEAENVLVEVGLKVVLADSVVRPVQPRLEVRENQVNQRNVRIPYEWFVKHFRTDRVQP